MALDSCSASRANGNVILYSPATRRRGKSECIQFLRNGIYECIYIDLLSDEKKNANTYNSRLQMT